MDIIFNQLKNIGQNLPYGALSEISEKTGFHYTTISRVLKTGKGSQKVIKATVSALSEINEVQKELSSKLNNML